MDDSVLKFYNVVAKSNLADKIDFNYINNAQYLTLFEQKDGKRIVGITNKGEWISITKTESFILKDESSYFKLINLLETPFSEIESNIRIRYKYLYYKYDIRNIFPFYEIIKYVFLHLTSMYWFELAYTWFEMLQISQKTKLKPILQEIITNNKLTQPLRQKITKELKYIGKY